jgi:hypothetical protein
MKICKSLHTFADEFENCPICFPPGPKKRPPRKPKATPKKLYHTGVNPAHTLLGVRVANILEVLKNNSWKQLSATEVADIAEPGANISTKKSITFILRILSAIGMLEQTTHKSKRALPYSRFQLLELYADEEATKNLTPMQVAPWNKENKI